MRRILNLVIEGGIHPNVFGENVRWFDKLDHKPFPLIHVLCSNCLLTACPPLFPHCPVCLGTSGVLSQFRVYKNRACPSCCPMTTPTPRLYHKRFYPKMPVGNPPTTIFYQISAIFLIFFLPKLPNLPFLAVYSLAETSRHCER